MRTDTPINYKIVEEKLKLNDIDNVGRSSIREIKKLIDEIEQASGEKFIRMEMGIPGLPPSKVGVASEIKALESGVASLYPDIRGIPALKEEMSLFVKNFLDIDVSPGFPVQKQQIRVLGQEYKTFDVYNYRGEKLRERLEEFLSQGDIASIIYSNPNNPSWICFTDTELQIIGELANKYNVIVIEDLAYFAMDFRKDYSVPGEAPFQPTVAKYTDNWVMLISSSKAFSYAGQRIGMLVLSNKLFDMEAPDLLRFYKSANVGHTMIFETLYSLSSGTSHSAQYALAGILKAVNEGSYKFLDDVKEYGEKAKVMKKIFLDNGFNIVYDKDEDNPIADGFYFTFSYPGFSGNDLLHSLVYYGISAISLSITGSERLEGIRACTSLISKDQFGDLEERLKIFNEHHKK